MNAYKDKKNCTLQNYVPIYIENCDKLNNKLLQSLNSEPRHRDKLCIQAGGTVTVLQIRANLHLNLMT